MKKERSFRELYEAAEGTAAVVEGVEFEMVKVTEKYLLVSAVNVVLLVSQTHTKLFSDSSHYFLNIQRPPNLLLHKMTKQAFQKPLLLRRAPPPTPRRRQIRGLRARQLVAEMEKIASWVQEPCGGGDVQVKKKRGRPRKYGPDGVAAAISPKPISSSAPAHPPVIDFSAPKRGKIRSPGSGIKFNKMSSEAADLLAARSEAAGEVSARLFVLTFSLNLTLFYFPFGSDHGMEKVRGAPKVVVKYAEISAVSDDDGNADQFGEEMAVGEANAGVLG
uniref:AT-hook motif nuclear-localized protein n=1 Tax=Kalanchoe fedtschenkoi TaxID=63787 RepID=A0A7N0VK91_KALFE